MLIGHYTIDSAPVESQLKRTLVCNPLIEGMEGVGAYRSSVRATKNFIDEFMTQD